MANPPSRKPELKSFFREIHRVETTFRLREAQQRIGDLERKLMALGARITRVGGGHV